MIFIVNDPDPDTAGAGVTTWKLMDSRQFLWQLLSLNMDIRAISRQVIHRKWGTWIKQAPNNSSE